MTFLVIPVALAAFAAWLTAVISCIAMVMHRAEGVSLFSLAFRGYVFFTGGPSFFTPAAEPHRKRFVKALLVFFGCVFGLIALSALLTASS